MIKGCSGNIATLMCGVCVLVARISSAQSCFQGLGDLPTGDVYSQAWAISADGQTVVGGSKVDNIDFPGTQRVQAFRWNRQSGMVALPFLPGQFGDTMAIACSGDGSVCVGYAGYGEGELDSEAVKWTASGGVVNLGHLMESFEVVATGVSFDGSMIVGYEVTPPIDALRWTSSNGVQHLTGMPRGSSAHGVSTDGSVVVGYYFTSPQFHAFRWTAAGSTDIGSRPGDAFSSSANAVSGDGQAVVGDTYTGNYPYDYILEAFRWTAPTGMITLGDLPGSSFRSRAWATNFDGSVIGGESETSLWGGPAFIWNAQRGMQQVYDVLTRQYGLDLSGWWLLATRGISADGRTLVGYGYHNGNIEAWVAHLGGLTCDADFNHDGFINSQDFFDYITAFFTTPLCPLCDQVPPGPCPADFNHDCLVSTADFFDFLAAFLAGCP